MARLLSLGLVGGASAAAVNLAFGVHDLITLKKAGDAVGVTGTADGYTKFLAGGADKDSQVTGDFFRKALAKFISDVYTDGIVKANLGTNLPAFTKDKCATGKSFASADIGLAADGNTVKVNLECVAAYTPTTAAKFTDAATGGSGADALAKFKAARDHADVEAADSDAHAVASGLCKTGTKADCATSGPTAVYVHEISSYEADVVVQWTMDGAFKASNIAGANAAANGDAGAAKLMHQIIGDAFKGASTADDFKAAAWHLGGATGPWWKSWTVADIKQSGSFTITADATTARRAEEDADENGALRSLAAEKKTHTIKVKDEHVKRSTLALMKTVYEGTDKDKIFTAKVDAAVTSAITTVCAGGKCEVANGSDVKPNGVKDQAPAFTTGDTASITIKKAAGADATWTVGKAAAAGTTTAAKVKVTGSLGMKLKITKTTTADALKKDAKFIALVKASLLDALKGKNAKITALPEFKITSLTWARMLEDGDVRMLADEDRTMTIGWSMEAADKAAADLVTAEAGKAGFGAAFKASFGTEAAKVVDKGIMGNNVAIVGDVTSSAAAAAATTSSAVNTFASGILFSLLSLSLM